MRSTSGGETSCGVWRGNFELVETDLPSECSRVGSFIKAVPPGTIDLFFGCRDENDFLYKEELTCHVRNETLTTLEVAMSRIGSEKVYVTHKLDNRSENISKLLLEKNAYVYICGDGNRMAKDVYAAFTRALTKHGNMSEKEAIEYLEDLKHRRRYLLDIWS